MLWEHSRVLLPLVVFFPPQKRGPPTLKLRPGPCRHLLPTLSPGLWICLSIPVWHNEVPPPQSWSPSGPRERLPEGQRSLDGCGMWQEPYSLASLPSELPLALASPVLSQPLASLSLREVPSFAPSPSARSQATNWWSTTRVVWPAILF